MPQDKNGNTLREGQQVLLLGTIVSIAPGANSSIAVRLGEGESYGNNVSVHSKHILLHPDEHHEKADETKMREAVHGKPDEDKKPEPAEEAEKPGTGELAQSEERIPGSVIESPITGERVKLADSPQRNVRLQAGTTAEPKGTTPPLETKPKSEAKSAEEQEFERELAAEEAAKRAKETGGKTFVDSTVKKPGTEPKKEELEPRAPNNPADRGANRLPGAGDQVGGQSTPHTTPDNAMKVAGADLPAAAKGSQG